MTDAFIADDGLAVGEHRLQRRIGTLVVMVAFADWLFYRHPVGVSAAIFLMALETAVMFASPIRATPRTLLGAIAVFAVTVTPLAVAPTFLALMFGVVGAAVVAVALTQGAAGWYDRTRRPWRFCSMAAGRSALTFAAPPSSGPAASKRA